MKILIPLFNGFEDAEAFTLFSLLRKVNVSFEIVGTPGTTVESNAGIRVFAEKRIDQINPDDYIAIILPSLAPENYARSSKLNEMVKRMYAQGKVIGAIGLAPLYLNKIGLLEGKRAVVAEGYERELDYPRAEPVVIDQNIITAKSFLAVPEFCVKLLNLLYGQEKALELKKILSKF